MQRGRAERRVAVRRGRAELHRHDHARGGAEQQQARVVGEGHAGGERHLLGQRDALHADGALRRVWLVAGRRVGREGERVEARLGVGASLVRVRVRVRVRG